MSEERLYKLVSHFSKLSVSVWDGQKQSWHAFKKRFLMTLDSSPLDLRLHLLDDRFHSPDVPVVDDAHELNEVEFTSTIRINVQKQRSLKSVLFGAVPKNVQDALLALRGTWTLAQATGWDSPDHHVVELHGQQLGRVLLEDPTVHTWWNYLVQRFEAQTQIEKTVLHRELQAVPYDPSKPIHEFITALEERANRLIEAGEDVSDTMKLSIIYAMLGAHAAHEETVAKLVHEGYSYRAAVDYLYVLFRNKESIDDLGGRSRPVGARAAAAGLEDASVSAVRFKKPFTCNHCHKPGHTRDRCYDLHPELRPKPGDDKKERDPSKIKCFN